jgi:hypothetical protein
MRSIAPLLLAGLAALTFAALPATALCADDGNGGCQAMAAPSVAFDVRSECHLQDDGQSPDGPAGLCLADDGNASNILAGNDLHLNVTNQHGYPIDFEVFVIQRADDAVDDSGEPVRLRADRIGLLEDVAAGETRYAKLAIDANATQLRFQALSSDGKHAEMDVQAMHIMYMTGLPEGGEGDGEVVDPAADQDGRATDAEADGKDAPYLGIVAVVGVLAAIVGLRRYD